MKSTPIVRAGRLIEAPVAEGDAVIIPTESDAWFAWLETAHTFAFDDPAGRFTARKKRRWDNEYWYAFRRLGGRLYETYLGKARSVTLGRLRMTAGKLNALAGNPAGVQQARAAGTPAAREGGTSGDTSHPAGMHTAGERLIEAPPPKLTPRQRQVLRLIASGASNNDIAEQLVVSPATVKRHVSNILMALDVKNRTQAVARGRELRLLDAEVADVALSGTDEPAASLASLASPVTL